MLKLAYYQNYSADSSQNLHSHKDHQILFVGGPNTRITNQDGGWPPSVLKNPKSPYLHYGLTDWHKIWHCDTYWASKPIQKLNFNFLKIQDGSKMADDHHLEKSKNGHTSATLGTLMDIGHPSVMGQ